jgi:hypothetical protein
MAYRSPCGATPGQMQMTGGRICPDVTDVTLSEATIGAPCLASSLVRREVVTRPNPRTAMSALTGNRRQAGRFAAFAPTRPASAGMGPASAA